MQAVYFCRVSMQQVGKFSVNRVISVLKLKYFEDKVVKSVTFSMKNLFSKIGVIHRFKITYYLFFCFVFFSISCNDKNEGKPQAPVLSFEGYTTVKAQQDGKDSILKVKIGFKDVNGDLGLSLSDTFPPYQGIYRFNLLVDMFDADNGGEDTIRVFGGTDAVVFHQRIPDLRPTGKSKYIEGSIDVSFNAGKLVLYPDKIKLYLQLIDRSLLKSERIDCGFIYLNH